MLFLDGIGPGLVAGVHVGDVFSGVTMQTGTDIANRFEAYTAVRIKTRNLRDLAAMELRFPQLRVCDPEQFLQELSEWQH